MVWSSVRLCDPLELAVILFQVCGVLGLCITRLLPGNRWADRGRVGFIGAMVGLGIAGAFCGRYDSEFALFAGGTMTLLLIGMTTGSGPADAVHSSGRVVACEPATIS